MAELTYADINPLWLEDASCTISYFPETDSWISYHDYIPDYIFHLRNNKLLSFFNKGLYLHNHSNRCLYYNNEPKECYITPVYTPYIKDKEERIYPFILNSINWSTDIFNTQKRTLNLTWSNISLHNSYQSTSKKLLVSYDSTCSAKEQFGNWNVRRINNYWNYSKFRDNTIDRNLKTLDEDIDDMFERNVLDISCNDDFKLRLKDDFVIVKLGYNNIAQNLLCFNELLFDVTPVKR